MNTCFFSFFPQKIKVVKSKLSNQHLCKSTLLDVGTAQTNIFGVGAGSPAVCVFNLRLCFSSPCSSRASVGGEEFRRIWKMITQKRTKTEENTKKKKTVEQVLHTTLEQFLLNWPKGEGQIRVLFTKLEFLCQTEIFKK